MKPRQLAGLASGQRSPSRRRFLQGAGGVLLAAPFLGSLSRRHALAQAPLPQRSVIYYTHNGCLTNRWFPSVEHGALEASALSGKTLEPLTPWLSKLLFPRGLRSLNRYGAQQAIDPKTQATGSKLTCAPLEDGTRLATSHSLDHEIARQLNPDAASPLVLSLGRPTQLLSEMLSFSGPGQVFAAETKPQAVYDLLLGGPGGASPAAYLIAQQKSILDAVRDDLSTYQASNLAEADAHRIDAWAELMRETELSMAEAALRCEPPADITPEALSAAGEEAWPQAFTLGIDMMLKLMALSLLCDANRSLVLTFPAYVTFDWDGIHHEYDAGGLAHRTGTLEPFGTCIPGVLEMLAEIDGWYAGTFARLVGLLDGIAEGEGTLLDNTATTWLPQFADGKAYTLNNLPIVIAGSAGGYLKRGASVNVEGGADTPLGTGDSEAACAQGGDGTTMPDTGSTTGNVPINKLYVTLLNALGCHDEQGEPVTKFGTFDGEEIADGILDPGELETLKA